MSEDATLVLHATEDFGDRYVEVRAWEVPQSERYPEGIKYAMQYGTTAGETIVRYDNFPDHPGATRHHVHRSNGDVLAIDFESLSALFQRFKREVNQHGHDW